MENASSPLLSMPMNVDIELPHVVSGSKRLGYYVAVALVLLLAWFVQSRKRTSQLDEVPFYSASKRKWIFDAEALIRDSYSKVSFSY